MPSFQYVKYEVISSEPEDDAIKHIRDYAVSSGIENPEIIGWDFPFVSQDEMMFNGINSLVNRYIIKRINCISVQSCADDKRR